MPDGLPEDIEIHLVVVMNDAVSHSHDFAPRQFGMMRSRLLGYARGCFTNDFNQASQSQL